MPELVVFVNKCDLVDDLELIEFVEMETRGLLNRFGFDCDSVPFIRGNALGALDNPSDPNAARCIVELLATIDLHISEPVRSGVVTGVGES